MISQTDLGATKSLEEVPLTVRLSNSLVAYVLYLWKMVWPTALAPIYPLRHDWAWWQVVGCGLLLLCISLWVALNASRRPHLLVGWCWYMVTLLPTIGLVQVGSQGMADRYSYVPLVGVFLLVVWEVSERIGTIPHAKPILYAGASAAIAACALCTFVTVQNWRSSIALFQHAIRVTRGNYIAYAQLGLGLFERGRLEEAEREFRESLRIRSNQLITELWLGEVLLREKDYPGAFEHYSSALKLRPTDPRPHHKIAKLLIDDSRLRDPRKALEEARLACELSRHRSREFEVTLAQICADNEQFQEATGAAQRALELSVSPAEIRDATQLEADLRNAEVARKQGIAERSSANQ